MNKTINEWSGVNGRYTHIKYHPQGCMSKSAHVWEKYHKIGFLTVI